MKDGYYISAYIEISKWGHLCYDSNRHDNCIALWSLKHGKVTLVRYWELERLTGVKQHRMACFSMEHFYEILSRLLRTYSLGLDDIEQIWGIPGLEKDKGYFLSPWHETYSYHSLCHASTCLFMDTEIIRKHDVLCFALDGGSDAVMDAYKEGKKTEVEKNQYSVLYSKAQSQEINIGPAYSPAVLWNIAAIYFKMREGSLMALASASSSTVYKEYDDILIQGNIQEEQLKYDQLVSLLEQIMQLDDADAGISFNGFDERFSKHDNRISMAMKVIQKMSQQIMKRNVEQAIEQYHIDPAETYLAMSGGFALNCPCNTYLLDEFGFRGFLAPPCVSDSGMALGIGLYAFYNYLGKDFQFKLNHAYYGGGSELSELLSQPYYSQFMDSVHDFDAGQVCDDIEHGPIVWFNGRSEIGPRALGNRSIIADPRTNASKDELNRIKLRQWWRPVAPIVLKEHMGEWFERDYSSPYMLQAIPVKQDKREYVPAIVHEDGSSRVQTIDEGSGLGLLYDVISEFYARTGIPIVCNTSLNDKGEPIIETAEEAMNFALRKGIPVVYVNGQRVVLKNHGQYLPTEPLKRGLKFTKWITEEQRKELISNMNSHGFQEAEIQRLYFYLKFMKDDELAGDASEVKRKMIESKLLLSMNRFVRMDYDFLEVIRGQIMSALSERSKR